jgi:hypothetical protein
MKLDFPVSWEITEIHFQIRGFAWPAVLVGLVAQSARYKLCLLFSFVALDILVFSEFLFIACLLSLTICFAELKIVKSTYHCYYFLPVIYTKINATLGNKIKLNSGK